MKRLTSLLILSLATLPGCGTKEKKEQPHIEHQPVVTNEPTFHYIESPSDTTLPTKTKPRKSDLEITNESEHPEIGE